MARNTFRSSSICKAISLIVVFTFSFSNIGFASSSVDMVSGRGKSFFGISVSDSRFAGGDEDKTLSPFARVFFSNNNKLVEEWVKTAAGEGMDAKALIKDPLKSHKYKATSMAAEMWFDRKKAEILKAYGIDTGSKSWKMFIDNDDLWGTILSNCLGDFGKRLRTVLEGKKRGGEYSDRYNRQTEIVICAFKELRIKEGYSPKPAATVAELLDNIKSGVWYNLAGEIEIDEDLIRHSLFLYLAGESSTSGVIEVKEAARYIFREVLTLLGAKGLIEGIDIDMSTIAGTGGPIDFDLFRDPEKQKEPEAS